MYAQRVASQLAARRWGQRRAIRDAELGAVRDGLGLSNEELATLARNSFEASFLDAASKRKHIAAVEACLADSTAV